ncbi:chemotaxis protein CheB [Hymenobacter sp. BT186]|uniref:protein-glutamate methylesterase n=1 Tax=Hymenobacter telluris TaxID=2816474 RepID=A0A939J8R6_9BACT|nr:chemotaxis protein CheB [Hymenobacter telluris]MBO0358044.1 chemotaxis protein CheB [Hymenobacter telluris]MBW3374071.1 chemotaxis protein CheB [Hymenobacter norwichensis]
MKPSYIIAIGTSAGGMPALVELVSQLPATLPAAVLVVQHLAPDSSGEHLVSRLSMHTRLRCHLAAHGDTLQAGHLYLAPADRHLLVHEGTLLVTRGPRENNYRPAVDALFRSVAVSYGTAVLGVILTGMLHDGTAGLDFIKRCGGRAIVQTPADAEFPSMPYTAMRNVAVDYVVPLSDMAALLQELTSQVPPPPIPIPEDLKAEAAIAERVVGTTEEADHLGERVPMTCPDCGGALWKLEHGNVLRFRCHTGHAFTADALFESSKHALEETLWVALRMMEERKNLLSSMAMRGEGLWSVQQAERLNEIKAHINRLREFLLNGSTGATTASEQEGG